MNLEGRPVPILAVAFIVLISACSQSGVHNNLLEIPAPSGLELMDRVVQEQYGTLREAVDATRKRGSDAELGSRYGQLGMWYHAYQLQSGADAAYRNARLLEPKALAWPYYQGRLALTLGNDEAAREALETTLSLHSGYVPALVSLAKLEYRNHNYELAEELFEEAVRVYPECDPALVGTARLAMDRGESERALVQLLEVLERQPRATLVHQMLGMAYREIGNTERSRHYLDSAQIELQLQVGVRLPDPLMDRFNANRQDARYFSRRAKAAMLAGRVEEAAQSLRSALFVEPERVAIRVNLGLTLRELGQLDESRAQLERSLKESPEHPKAQLQLAFTYESLGELAAASRLYESLLALDPRMVVARLRWARLLQSSGDFETSLVQIQAVLDENPHHGEGLFLRGLFAARQDRWRDAVLDLEAAWLQSKGRLRENTGRLLARLLAASPLRDLRDGDRALSLLQIQGADSVDSSTAEVLAMALAETGDFQRAVAVQRNILQAAGEAGLEVAWVRRRLDLYLAEESESKPWQEGERPLNFVVKVPR